jgi:acid stress-induced BolA-like protein IbaG/YrbA
MERFAQQVREIIEAEFSGARTHLEETTAGRLAGRMVWSGFDGLDQVERQEQLRGVLRNRLGETAAQVSVILTYTPGELQVMQGAAYA